ncbi:Fe-S cluster assembly protein SufD [Algivirga pacifica]|uniref:Fe-S cluster assembly protein SufD n=1 Tax=Algivirga pacifica TaxID=1162670 RepID=A0ABP9CZL8_9BACT
MSKFYVDAALKNDALSHLENIAEAFEAEGEIASKRRSAAEAFSEMDFPSIKHEEWKYTNVKKLISKNYQFGGNSAITAEQLELIKDLEAHVLVFVNGQYRADLSNIKETGKMVIAPLSEAVKSHTEVVEKHFGAYAKVEEESFPALNTAFAEEGVFIHVPKSVAVETPVYALYVVDTNTADTISQPRNLVVVEENAQFTFIENSQTIGEEHTAFINAVSEVFVAPNAIVDHYKIQNDETNAMQVSTTAVEQSDRSVYNNTVITVSGGLIRNNLNIALGEHCENHMNGLYILNGKTHVDNHTAVDHKKPNSNSNELYKGILDGQSTGVFNGKIFVREGAQKTNAFQSNKNILMSDQANCDTKPQLEIWADDVSCSHGCTVGALDEEPMFYLRARGISEDKARALLMFAFAGDVLEKVKVPALKSYIERIIAKRLNYDLD